MRKHYPFNDGWLYAPGSLPFTEADKKFEPVSLPHSNRVFSHRTVYEDDYQFESTYRKRFKLPEVLDGQRAFLDFGGAMQVSRVYLNDELVGQHAGGYTAFSVDLTEQLQEGENTLHVLIDSRELPNIPPNGHRLDYLSFGGIYRDVALRLVSGIYIRDIYVKTQDVLTTPRLKFDLELNQAGKELTIGAILIDSKGNEVATTTGDITGMEQTVEFMDPLLVDLWSIDHPTLYTLRVLVYKNGEPIDQFETKIGFRTADFNVDGKFYLNGKPLKLIGVNRHQTYPYIGMAAPARLQRMDADIIKHELGCNVVRTSHYPQSPAFLDRCDEIGLLVLEEMPGWQHIGDLQWQDLLLEQMQEMIMRDRNRPAIILWGVRINESPDDPALYARTNELAHKLDPFRQTGGIRNFIGSQMMEDVFTFNDFSLGLTEPTHTPHLITEFAGHVFPTKAWDNEDRLIEQALIHARKHNLQMGHAKVAGAIGWCAFDYNTHPEFGSGDRICHHGVMDLFRLPKWAAYFYRSQKSPEQEIVLKAATYWTYGDRTGGGNNPLTIFSNCDEIEVFIGTDEVGRFTPDVEQFPHLPHPPFTVRWPLPYNPWGTHGDLKIVGYLGGKQVAEQKIATGQRPHKFTLRTDSRELHADGGDMTRLVVSIEDKYANPLPYQLKPVTLTLDGEGQIIGENPLFLISGTAGFFVKAGKKAGSIIVKAKVAGFEEESITILVS